jgi:hypothetical protein
MSGCLKLFPFHQIFWPQFCSVIHTQNKIILISIIVRINWVVSKCCSIVASHLLCIFISVAPLHCSRIIQICVILLNLMTEHSHVERKRWATEKAAATMYLWLQYQYWFVKIIAIKQWLMQRYTPSQTCISKRWLGEALENGQWNWGQNCLIFI